MAQQMMVLQVMAQAVAIQMAGTPAMVEIPRIPVRHNRLQQITAKQSRTSLMEKLNPYHPVPINPKN
jgi:hypothetical protein